MSLDARRGGQALRAATGDLLRAWRSTRHTFGDGAATGPLDGVVEEFLERVADALLQGDAPETAWARTGGVVRLPVGTAGRALAAADLELAANVLAAAGLALELAPAVTAWIRRAVDAAVAALPVDGPARPREVLVVRVLG